MKRCAMHKTRVFLPASQFFFCTHCQKEMCLLCLKDHQNQVKHAFMDVPEALRRSQ